MKDRSTLAVLGAGTLTLACVVAACGSYDNPAKPGTGGTGGTMATGGTGGTMMTGGTGGTMMTGGTGGGVGAGGSSGGAGGSAGAATGGSAGTTGGAAGAGGSAGTPGAGMGGMGGDAGGGGSAGAGARPACPADPPAAPCGGDVVGTWAAADCEVPVTGMADISPLGIGCVAAPVTGSITVSGTWTATADGMYTDNTTTTGSVVLELPPACLEVSGFQTTCDRLLFDPIGLPYPDPNGFPCVDNATTMGCTCSLPVNQMGSVGSIRDWTALGPPTAGTYTAMGNELVTTTTSTNSPAETSYSYCVAGTSLALTLDPGLIGTIMGPIVLQKQ